MALLASHLASAQLTITPGTTLALTSSTKMASTASVANQGTISNTGTVYLYRNWVNTGSYTGVGGLSLIGTNQVVNHGGQELASLLISGGGTKQITGNLNISEALIFSSGLVSVSDNVSLQARSTASITGASAASYVNGSMQISGTGRHYYPIGTLGTFAPVELLGVVGTAPVVSFRVIEPHPPTQNGFGIEQISEARYWERTVVSGEMNAGKITLPAVNESFIDSMSKASIAASNELGSVYESLGQQTATGTVANGTVTSFDNALFNFYALARELNEGRLADSIALVKIYERANGTNWTNSQNWLSATIDTWSGVSVQGERVVGINLAANNLTGQLTSDLRKLSEVVSMNFSNNELSEGVPASIIQLTNLQTLNLSNNQLEDLPDVSALSSIQLLDVSSNKLQFDDLEPNVSLPNFNYLNQSLFGAAVDSLLPVHQAYTHTMAVGGSANQYQWYRNGESVAAANSLIYNIQALNYNNMGDYQLRVANTLVPDLVLSSNTQRIRATAYIQGKIVNQTGGNVGQATGSALGIQPGKYDTLGSYTSGVNGSYVVTNLVLGDYILYASQNNEVYIPTYYSNSIDWAFADLIALRDNTSAVNLTLQYRPRQLTPDDGDNTVSGVLDEDVPDGKVLNRERVNGAGVTMSRQRFRGKGTDEEVEYELLAFTQTDENGEFIIENLPDGIYRVNIQYPGVPMDPNSFVEFEVGGGDGVEAGNIVLDALVTPEGIVVTKVEETGIFLSYFKNLEVYPNPADKFVTIRYDKLVKGKVVAELLDLNGNSLMSAPLKARSKANQQLDVEQFNNGIYLLRFHDELVPGRPIVTYRIIISR